MIEKVAFVFEREPLGTPLTICDVIECEEKRWIVTKWIDIPARGKTTPEKVICLSLLPHQHIPDNERYCFLLTNPMPKDVFYGGRSGLCDGLFYRVIPFPNVELDKPELLQ